MSVMRSKGYEGSSLNDLSASSGLHKASLYHRFPGGKKEIALMLLDYVGEWVSKNINQVVANQSLSAEKRLRTVLRNIDELYGGGRKTCILRALSMDGCIADLGGKISEIMNQWMNGFTVLGRDFGYAEQESAEMALQVLATVQGHLIVAQGVNAPELFKKGLTTITKLYLPEN